MRKSPITQFWLLTSHSWLVITLLILIVPVSNLYAQDEEDYDDPTEVFWGDDEGEYEEDDEYYDDEDEYYEDDTSEYYDDEEYFDDEEYYDEGDESEYYEDDEYSDDEGEYEEDLSDTELADIATNLGYSLNISGASPGFVNHDLNTYNNNPQVNFRISIEFPMLMQFAGIRFRFGAEVGNFGFENYLPQGGKFSGMTAMGMLAFPAGPGKLILGAGLIGDTFGVSGETSYGFALGNTLEIRGGVRYTTALNVKDDKKSDLGTASWMDGLIMLGFNL